MNDLSVADLVVTDETMLDRYDRVAAAHHAAAAIHYFGRTITWAELDRIGDEIAAGLRTRGIVGGDRVALLMQNVPQYMLTLVGVWKAGATAVPINPMLTPREVRFILDDAGAAALFGLDELLAAALDPDHGPPPALTVLVSTRRDEYAAEWPDRFERGPDQPVTGAVEWVDLLAGRERIEHAAATPPGRADDAAVITYTSGTTGPPKGAVNTHRNVLFACRFYEQWMALDQRDVILGIAPLFHITGLVGHIGPCLVTGAALVLGYRFDVDVLAELAERHRATFTIGAITAFIAFMNHPAIGPPRPLLAGEGVQRRRSHRPDARSPTSNGSRRAVHPQHLRADRGDGAVPRRAARRTVAGRSGERCARRRGAGVQHRGPPGP